MSTAVDIKGDEPGVSIGDSGTAELTQGEEWIQPTGEDGSPQKPEPEKPADKPADRPDWIPEKFWTGNLEESSKKLAESYQRLESGKAGEEDADDSAGDAPEGDKEGDDAQTSAVEAAMAAYDKDGKLGDEHYAALEEAGVPREAADAYIRNVESTRLLAFTAAGGEDQYTAMTEWAGKNLTAAEQEAFNAALEGTPAEMVEAIQGLSQRYSARSSKEPKLVSGENGASVNSGFKSKAEMTAAMSDPRYSTDPAFRKEVAEKIAAADRAGVNLWV